jgi:hypothetical protein
MKMGYYVSMEISNVKIAKDNAKECLDRINNMIKEHPNGFFGWVSYPEGGCKSLKEAVRMWRFECSENEEGLDIEYFTGEKWSSDEPLFFEAIAPFVKNGEIACTGEDGEKWRYLFENGDVKEQYAVITWADY